MYAEINTTNIRKAFYKKRDLLADFIEENEKAQALAATAPVYIDSHGEELVDHVS